MKNIKRIFYICTLIAALASSLSAQVTATLTQPKGCENNGMIELEIEGDGPFTIDWTTLENDGFSPHPVEVAHEEWNNQTKITDLPPGQYCVTVKNAKCCEAKQCFWLDKEGGNLKVAYKKNVSTCAGKPKLATDGEIYIEIPPKYQESDYDFKWTYKTLPNWIISTKKDLTNVQAETYVLTAYNKITGCEETIEVKLCCCPSVTSEGEPVVLSTDDLKNACVGTPNITVEVKATPPSIKGAKNGSIILTITGGGSDPIFYRWKETKSGKEYFTKDLTNLPSGNYCYTVTNGCRRAEDCVPIYVCGEEGKPLAITQNVAIPCFYTTLNKVDLSNSGAIEIFVTGGQAPYKYKWANGATTKSLAKLKQGTYCVTVTDKGGCTISKCIDVSANKPETKKNDPTSCATGVYCGTKLVDGYDNGYNCNSLWEQNCGSYVCKCNDNGKVLKNSDGSPKLVDAPLHFCLDKNSCKLTAECINGSKLGPFLGNTIEKTESGYDIVTNKFVCCRVTYCRISGQLFVVDVKQGDVIPSAISVLDNDEMGCTVEYKCYDGIAIGGFKIYENFLKPCPNKLPHAEEARCDEVFPIVDNCWDEVIGSGGNDFSNFISSKSFDPTRIITDSDKIMEYLKKDLVSLKIVSAAPNPFNDKIDLSIFSNEDQQLTIVMQDIFGNVVYKKSIEVLLGINKIDIKDLGELKNDLLYSIYIFDKAGNSSYVNVLKLN